MIWSEYFFRVFHQRFADLFGTSRKLILPSKLFQFQLLEASITAKKRGCRYCLSNKDQFSIVWYISKIFFWEKDSFRESILPSSKFNCCHVCASTHSFFSVKKVSFYVTSLANIQSFSIRIVFATRFFFVPTSFIQLRPINLFHVEQK
jgi:hypothetical protein